MPSLVERSRASLLGLAIGDAMGAPTEGMTPDGIRERYGRVTDFVDEDAAGTDDTEYAVLAARGILKHGHALKAHDVADVWRAALEVQDGGFHGAGFSEMIALAELQKGVQPPTSDARGAESWSDGAAMRAAPFGVFCPGDPAEAARLAGIDASVSHSSDGIYCAEAVAAAVSVALVGGSLAEVLDAALAALPVDSWSRRTVDRALAIAAETTDTGATGTGATNTGATDTGATGIDAACERLYAEISIFHYPWADSAPEALAITLGIVAASRGDFLTALFASVNIGRDSDTIAAMAGAICGAMQGTEQIPDAWVSRIREVRGRCVTSTAGTDLLELADALAAGAHS